MLDTFTLSLLPDAPVGPITDGAAAPSPSAVAAVSTGGGVAHGGASAIDEMAEWAPAIRTADADMLPEKRILDARSMDVARNDAYVGGAVRTHQNGIVGSWYTLNAKPRSAVLFGKRDEVWETEAAEEIETLFALWGESIRAWPDAARRLGFTEIIRLAVGMSVAGTGEVLMTSEWMDRGPDRLFRSAVQMIDPIRLSDPMDALTVISDKDIRQGVERNRDGEPIAYYIRVHDPSDARFRGVSLTENRWKRVKARTSWGRPLVAHIYEPTRPDQTRGVSMMASALKEMRMLHGFRQTEIQRATLAAMYAASIESELPDGDIYAAMGGQEVNPAITYAEDYLNMLATYTASANNLHVNGAKIPVFAPGTKLKIQNPGAESPVGEALEAAFLRHMAAALDLSYEQLSKDYTKTNYSSARAAFGESWRAMQARKKLVADKVAGFIYHLWLEEAINRRLLTTFKRRSMPSFYDGLNAEAYTYADWIGAGQGLIDPLKETQADTLALKSNLTTLEAVIARRSGKDWRDVARQIAREREEFKRLDIPSIYDQDSQDMQNSLTAQPNDGANQ